MQDGITPVLEHVPPFRQKFGLAVHGNGMSQYGSSALWIEPRNAAGHVQLPNVPIRIKINHMFPRLVRKTG